MVTFHTKLVYSDVMPTAGEQVWDDVDGNEGVTDLGSDNTRLRRFFSGVTVSVSYVRMGQVLITL